MARYSRSDGVRGIEGEDGVGWLPADGGAWTTVIGDATYVLEKRTRNRNDECLDTGWYLYDDQPNGIFGEWCARRLLEAVDEANRKIAREK